MLRTLLDFFCSRPFADRLSVKTRVILSLNALLWGVVAFALGAFLTGDYAMPGENARSVGVFSGAIPGETEAYPILWGIKSLLLGASPSIRALNLLGAALMGVLAMITYAMVHFWTSEAADDDSVVAKRTFTAALASNLACLLLIGLLPGLYMTAGFTTVVWAFLWLPLCAVLQNFYAQGGGHRRGMILFGLVLGVAIIESPWALAFLPLFFLRAVAMEWRLWDHNVRNLPLWFVSVVVGAAVMLSVNAARFGSAFSPAGIWETEAAVLRNHLGVLAGLLSPRWILDIGLSIGWALMAWITARRLINNDRKWGLLVTALAMTAVGVGLVWMVRLSPMRTWLHIGRMPVATLWVTVIAFAMLTVGWGTQLFARNPNLDEERDRHRMPARVKALRVAAFFLFPLCVLAVIAAEVRHIRLFASVDRALPDRFAQYIVDRVAPDADGPAANRPFVLGSYWVDDQLLLAAYRSGTPLTLISMNKAYDKAYIADLHVRLREDPLLESADRLRLNHLLDYSFPVFVQDFFASQANVGTIAAVFDQPQLWHAARLQPAAVGPLYVGAPESGEIDYDIMAPMKAFRETWASLAEETPDVTVWWDISAQTARNIRHHLAYMTNNLGAWLDDRGRLKEAAECYLEASQIEKENISALLNLYDICVRRGQIPERKIEIMKAFEDFISERTKNPVKYDLNGVGQYYGFIRNYDLFVQMGWEWAVNAAPETILAGLRNAQTGLDPNDPRSSAVQAVTAAVYELQGQTRRSAESYLAAVQADPSNVDAMRGLARLAIQSGDVSEAGQWISKAEAAGADSEAMELDQAAYLMARGDLEGANKAISSYTTRNPDSVVGWAMLGMLRVEQGNLADAGGFILENIRRKARDRDIYFYHVLQGRITQERARLTDEEAVKAERDGKRSLSENKLTEATKLWDDARKHYRRAYAVRSNVRGILEIILNIDRRLEDKTSAEVDALAILRDEPTHGYANFIVGSQRLEDAHIGAAIKYLKAAVEGNENPTVDLINNYADALSRTDDTALAKDVALRAVRLAPRSYATWGTLALAQARCGDLEGAKNALSKSRGLPGGDDSHLFMVDFWIAVAKGDRDAAARALENFRRPLEAASDELKPLDAYDIRVAEETLQTL